MKLKRIVSMYLLSLAGMLAATAAAEEPSLPPNKVTLPLPKGQSMEFSLIKVSDDPNLFSMFEFSMGESAEAEFPVKAAPTTVSGTVYTQDEYWALPMACTEVTRAQYAAVMTPDKMPAEADAKLPQTNVSRVEIMQFIEKLNIWLSTDAKAKEVMGKLAASKRHGTPFVKLPTEAEWEFSARGGTLVPDVQFADSIPYDDESELARSENIATQKGSKLKPVASTGKCNPCGLYDMFGNAAEMVDGTFHAEYAFGRSGAYVVRGADYMTKAEDATSFRRTEVPFLEEKGTQPYRKNSVGFRLSIGSPVFATAVLASLESDWSEYDAKRIVINPGDSGSDATSAKLSKDEGRMMKTIELAVARLEKDPGNARALEQLQEQGRTVQEMKKKIAAAEHNSAQAGTRMLYNTCYNTYKETARKLVYDPANSGISDPDQVTTFNQAKNNIKTNQEDLQLACKMLADLTPEIVDEHIGMVLQRINGKEGLSAEQKAEQGRVFNLGVEAYRKARASGEMNKTILDEWARNFENLPTVQAALQKIKNPSAPAAGPSTSSGKKATKRRR